ncbi:pectate lyase domain-containing protein [Ditylenchus destructor]|uniref:Probable pectate lyase F n=1 Tax=Ditylenchus destructor TaxID=166010 RepID=A0AAD4MJX8_9BILA|nr:pectate lyase domain-containing protein [Ditylenchus destructor]
MTYLHILIILFHAGLVFGCEFPPWPTPKETVKVDNPQTIKAGQPFDGQMKRYVASKGDGGQGEGQPAVFRLADGATLKNVVIGKPGADGVHCMGSCTLENVWWEDVGEDAATFKGDAKDTYKVIGGGAKNASDKVFQHNGGGTLTVSNFQVETFGKLYRSCGNCKNNGPAVPRKAFLDCIKATGPGMSLAAVNANYGDSATLTNIQVQGKLDEVCATYEGNNTEKEPPVQQKYTPATDGDGKTCNYKKSDVKAS